VLSLAKERVNELLKERDSIEDKNAVSEAVALGAVLFHDLHSDPVRDVEFDIEKVVDFEGETGPYLQYAHTRCLSILRKAKDSGEYPKVPLFQAGLIAQLTQTQELLLVKTLGQFPTHIERALEFSKASQLAHYLIDVAQAFGSFYRECHVLGQAPELTQARLMLVEAARRVLGQGLSLMGIPVPERM
jgi:arginyl-tRNA synthetase